MVKSDLAHNQRRTTGDVPPATMGSTITVVGKKIYVIAGRLVSTKEMTLDVYCLDLTTHRWKKLAVDAPNSPPPRYFHVAVAYGQSIVVHGGMGNLEGAEALCVLADVIQFDTKKETWTTCYSPDQATAKDLQPRPRYAHLAVVSNNKLVILGGQDIQNDYLEDAALYDLQQHTWTGIHPLAKQCGAYRSIAVNVDLQPDAAYPTDSNAELSAADKYETACTESPATSRESWPSSTQSADEGGDRKMSSIRAARRHSRASPNTNIKPRSERTERGSPNIAAKADHIWLYSNFSFRDVQRELHLLAIVKDEFQSIQDQSATLVGPILPPGLRFPDASIIGGKMLLSGTYLSNASQSFNLWVMSLTTFQWDRIDLDALLSTGSWNKGVYCEATESFIILGNRDRILLDDYNKRQVNYDHTTIVNLEAYELSSPIGMNMSPIAKDLGLMAMADTVFTDTDLITSDGTIIPVLSKILLTKWPEFIHIIGSALNHGRPYSQVQTDSMHDSTIADRVVAILSAQDQANTSMLLNYATTRPRCFYLPYPHILVHAFVQFLYTDQLPPSMAHSVDQLCALLLFGSTIDERGRNPYLYRLKKLCNDRLYDLISPQHARRIFEIGILTGQKGLQLRAKKVLGFNGQPVVENEGQTMSGQDFQLNQEAASEKKLPELSSVEIREVLDGEVTTVEHAMEVLIV